MQKYTWEYKPDPESPKSADAWLIASQDISWSRHFKYGMMEYRFRARRANEDKPWYTYIIWCQSDEVYKELVKNMTISAGRDFDVEARDALLQEDDGQLLMF